MRNADCHADSTFKETSRYSDSLLLVGGARCNNLSFTKYASNHWMPRSFMEVEGPRIFVRFISHPDTQNKSSSCYFLLSRSNQHVIEVLGQCDILWKRWSRWTKLLQRAGELIHPWGGTYTQSPSTVPLVSIWLGVSNDGTLSVDLLLHHSINYQYFLYHWK